MRSRRALYLIFTTLSYVILPLFALLVSAQEASPAPASPAPKPDEVVRRALADQQSMLQLLDKYSYTKHIVSETASGKGKVTSHEERVFNFAPCGTRTCIMLVSVNGAAPKPKELKEHEKAVKKEWEKQDKKSPAERQKEEDDDLFVSKDFLRVYDFAEAGNEVHDGTASQMIDFTPKAEPVELADKDNKVLTKLAGRMWIAEVDRKIVSAEMHMVKPIKVWGGFAGAIKNMTVHQDYVVDKEGIYLPKKNTIEMELRVLLSTARLKLVEEYSDFKRAPAGAEAKETPAAK